MVIPSPEYRSLRLAIVTNGISHFEVPLFRLCAKRDDLQVRVFYHLPVKQGIMDADYGQKIDWGGDMLAGYESHRSINFAGTRMAVAEWGADVTLVYGYSWSGFPRFILSNWMKRRPQIHRGTLNYYYDPRHLYRSILLRPLGRLLLSLFDAHHYGGAYSRRVLQQSGVSTAAQFFVPYSVDTPFFDREAGSSEARATAAEMRRKLGWGESDLVLLFIAQHNWFKGPDIAMDCFRMLSARHPRMRFIVVGSGSMTEEMKVSARKYLKPECVHFAGFVPSLDTPAYYLASDLVLCSSRYETWARMLNEAMLCRCPAVISEIVPAAGDLVIHDQTGYVVKRPDPELLMTAVEQHFSKPESSRMAMRDAAHARAMEFAYESWMDNVVAAAHYAISLQKRKQPTRGRL